MKMNRINGSKFPSWLFSRFQKQENPVDNDIKTGNTDPYDSIIDEAPGDNSNSPESSICDAKDVIETKEIEIPATVNALINTGNSINIVDPLKILDQLGEISEKRSKRRKQ